MHRPVQNGECTLIGSHGALLIVAKCDQKKFMRAVPLLWLSMRAKCKHLKLNPNAFMSLLLRSLALILTTLCHITLIFCCHGPAVALDTHYFSVFVLKSVGTDSFGFKPEVCFCNLHTFVFCQISRFRFKGRIGPHAGILPVFYLRVLMMACNHKQVKLGRLGPSCSMWCGRINWTASIRHKLSRRSLKELHRPSTSVNSRPSETLYLSVPKLLGWFYETALGRGSALTNPLLA